MSKAVKKIFGGGSQPKPPVYTPPPDPQIAKDQIAAANAAERAKLRAQTGRESTNVTGGEGDVTKPNVRKTVLGA